MENIDDFRKWIKDTQKNAEDWVAVLAYKAKREGKTYQGAIRWLRKSKPDFPISYKATPTECVTNVVQSIYEEAIFKVRDEALGKEIKDND